MIRSQNATRFQDSVLTLLPSFFDKKRHRFQLYFPLSCLHPAICINVGVRVLMIS